MKKLPTLLFAGISFYGCLENVIEETLEDVPTTQAAAGSMDIPAN